MLLSADTVIITAPSTVEISQHDTLAADGGFIVDLKVNGTLTTYGDANNGIDSLDITGSTGSDTYTLLTKVTAPLSIHGGGGTDTIVGPDDGMKWSISGPNAGSAANAGSAVDNVHFDGVANITGGAGDDDFKVAVGGSLSGLITGGDGANSLTAGDAANVWVLGAANTLNGTAFSGVERLVGGNQNDTYQIAADSNLGSIQIDDVLGGVDTLDFSSTTSSGVKVDLSSDAEQTVNSNLTLKLSSGDSIENVIGTALDDTLTGNVLDNRITGGGGNDKLDGGVGDDVYVFADGWGTDTITERPGTNTGEGSDTLDFSAVSVSVTVAMNVDADGNNRVSDGTNSVLMQNVETIIGGSGLHNALDYSLFSGTTGVSVSLLRGTATGFLSVSGFSDVTGSSLDDTIFGDQNANILIGGAGDDTMGGLGGADTLDGGTGINTLWERQDADMTLTDASLVAGGVTESSGGFPDGYPDRWRAWQRHRCVRLHRSSSDK